MNKLSALIAASTALTMLAVPTAAQDRPRGDAKLAQMLEGRVAGEPQSCIRLMGNDRLTIIEGTAVVAKRGDTIWVNRTAHPDSLDDDDAMSLRRFSPSQLCRIDQVTTFSRTGQFYTGNIFLADFVPYRRGG